MYTRNSFCEGGHGLSIGSLGSGGSVADVENVLYAIFWQVIAYQAHNASQVRKHDYGTHLYTAHSITID